MINHEALDRASTLVKSEFLPFTVMLCIFDRSERGWPAAIANGTGSLIDTGLAKILVTNHHVYEAFRSRQADSPDFALKMSGADGTDFIEISDLPVVGLSRERDLAVFSIPEANVLPRGKRFVSCTSWPPPRPDIGAPAYFVGYPGDSRKQFGDKVEMRPALFVTRVHSIREDRFILVDPNGVVEVQGPDGTDPLISCGGMSGSTVYVSIDERTFCLVGFMCEQAFSMAAIRATFADCINADGTISEDNS